MKKLSAERFPVETVMALLSDEVFLSTRLLSSEAMSPGPARVGTLRMLGLKSDR